MPNTVKEERQKEREREKERERARKKKHLHPPVFSFPKYRNQREVMQQAECDVNGTVLYSLASSPPYFCNQTQGCARDRAEHRTVQYIRGMYGG